MTGRRSADNQDEQRRGATTGPVKSIKVIGKKLTDVPEDFGVLAFGSISGHTLRFAPLNAPSGLEGTLSVRKILRGRADPVAPSGLVECNAMPLEMTSDNDLDRRGRNGHSGGYLLGRGRLAADC